MNETRATRGRVALLLCAWYIWLWWPAVLEEAAEIHLAFEVGLGVGSEGSEDFWVDIPGGDAAMVLTTVFIVNDKRDDLIPEAFLQHDQSTKAAVSIFEGVDAFKADMEMQDILQGNIALGLIFLQQGGQRSMDIFGLCAVLMRLRPELAGAHGAAPISLHAIEQKAM